MAQTSRAGTQYDDITDDITRSINDDSAALENVLETPVPPDDLNDILRSFNGLKRKLLDFEQTVQDKRPKKQCHKTATSGAEPDAEKATDEEAQQPLNAQSQCSKENATLGAKPDTANITDREDDDKMILLVDKPHDPISSVSFLRELLLRLPSKGHKAVQSYTDSQRNLKFDEDAQTKRLLKVTVLSIPLKKLLSEALSHYPGHWDEGISFVSDGLSFAPLIHNWDNLQDLVRPLETTTDEDTRFAREHLKQLLDRVQQSCEYFPSRKMICEDRIVSFDWLWTIFPPGSLVYETKSNQPRVLMISSAQYTRKNEPLNWTGKGEVKELSLLCWDYGSPLKPV